jgi:deoxyadenosine/deoxycytidine kinase
MEKGRQAAIEEFVKCIKTIPKNVRFMRRFKRIVVVINGPVGAGKTTLVKILAETAQALGLPTLTFFERVPPELLAQFLKAEDEIKKAKKRGEIPGPNPFAFDLQMEMLNIRIEDGCKAIKEREHYFVIVDRNIYGDFPFARANYERGNFTDAQWLRYMERFKEADILEPDLYVHLKVSLDVTIERIGDRARENEDTYDPTYLQLVQDIDNAVTDALKCPVLELPWNHRQDVKDPKERFRIGLAVFKAMDDALVRDADVNRHIQVVF